MSDGVSSARRRGVLVPRTGLDLVDRAFAALAEVIRPLLSHPRVDQTTLEGVGFVASVPATIEHRLGRPYRGWSVARVRGSGSTFFEVPPERPELELVIIASDTCVADVEVW